MNNWIIVGAVCFGVLVVWGLLRKLKFLAKLLVTGLLLAIVVLGSIFFIPNSFVAEKSLEILSANVEIDKNDKYQAGEVIGDYTYTSEGDTTIDGYIQDVIRFALPIIKEMPNNTFNVKDATVQVFFEGEIPRVVITKR